MTAKLTPEVHVEPITAPTVWSIPAARRRPGVDGEEFWIDFDSPPTRIELPRRVIRGFAGLMFKLHRSDLEAFVAEATAALAGERPGPLS